MTNCDPTELNAFLEGKIKEHKLITYEDWQNAYREFLASLENLGSSKKWLAPHTSGGYSSEVLEHVLLLHHLMLVRVPVVQRARAFQACS